MAKKWIVKFDRAGHPRLNGKRGTRIAQYESCRKVYKFGKVVLKIDTQQGSCGYQCAREAATYKAIPKKDRKYFAAILDSGSIGNKDYVIQIYVKDTKYGTNSRFYDARLRTVDRLARRHEIEDINDHDENWAINTRGNLKIIDLGLGSGKIT